MLRKHGARFGNQWDEYLSAALCAYCNTPHETTGEKPSFLIFGLDCCSPTEAALLPTSALEPTDISDDATTAFSTKPSCQEYPPSTAEL